MKKQIITLGIVTAVGVAGVTGIGVANAASNHGAGPFSGLVDAISSKFNLNKADVQKVVDDQRTAHRADQEIQIKADLAKLVTDGKLTQAQSDAILAKRTELQNQRTVDMNSGNTKTRAQMRADMDAQRTALQTWAKDNNIPTQYLHFVVGGGERGGIRGHEASEVSESQE